MVGSSGSPEAFRAAVEPVTRVREREGLTGALRALVHDQDAGRPRELAPKVRSEYEAAGATGIIIPRDPRLLDLLRNGDEEDDRSDLGLAQG